MLVDILIEDSRTLAAYASIPIAFEVREVVDLDALAPGHTGGPLPARALDKPYSKDYDAYPDNGPLDWPARFRVERWTFFAAYVGERRVGGSVVIMDDPDVELLDGRADVALLWDLRVAPEFRRRGVARALLSAVEAWARACGAEALHVETQDVNVGACRFYSGCGFALSAVHERAYPDFPDERQLIWTKVLAPLA
jgi:GNAT superfamily N-acetyltransferase